MEYEVKTALGHINTAIKAREAGQHDEARGHIIQAIIKSPESEVAWLWLAEVSDDPGERRYSLDRAIDINPESTGRRERARLLSVDPVVPEGLADVYHPPMPPSFRRPRKTLRIRPASLSRNRTKARAATSHSASRPAWPWIAIVALVLIGLVATIFFQPGSNSERRYIAVVAPLSGPDAEVGQDARDGARLAAKELNDRFDGPDLELIEFDDQNDPERAVEIAQEIVNDDRILAVIGHSSSATTLAAIPIYEEAGLPVISGQATANDLDASPTFFRTTSTDQVEGSMLAEYARAVLGYDQASIITGESVYEQEVSTAFNDAFAANGTIGDTWTVSGEDREGSIEAIVEGVRETPEDALILLSLNRADARDVIVAIRRAELPHRMLGVESMGSSKFVDEFANEPEEQETRGYFTEGLYVSSPLIFDSAVGDALAFARNFRDMTGRLAGWRGATSYDAVIMADNAIRETGVSSESGDIDAHRQQVAEHLRANTSPDDALRGATGPLYVDEQGNVPRAFAIGIFTDGHVISAPTQYRLVLDPDEEETAADIENGVAFRSGDHVFQQYRVASVGVVMIELRDLDTSSQTFYADFFIYFRYYGDDEPTNIVFTNAQDKSLSVGDPVAESVEEDSVNYKLFRVSGTFSEPMRFADYPWDKHELSIRFQNQQLEQSDLVYAADVHAIGIPQEDRLASGFDRSQPFNRVPSWNTDRVEYAQFAVTSATESYVQGQPVEYSEFRTLVHVERQVASFLFKNLLQLFLLSIVTYVFLWFPAEQAGARLTASITALLTSAVMLNNVSSQLPDIGYTVAIEWGFYIYLATAATLILMNVAVDRSYKAKRYGRVRALDITIRTLFPLIVLSTIAAYWIMYM